MKQKTVFLTGCTGYLGSHVGYALLQQGVRVIALVRSKVGGPSPADRARAAIEQIHFGAADGENLLPFNNLTVIDGDVREGAEALIAKIWQATSDPIDEVWHCAALLKFKERDRAEIEETNIRGTENILSLVQNINVADAPRYFHVSTAYSGGRTQRAMPEELCTQVGAFRSFYDWSKHHGEQIVAAQQEMGDLDATIFRPSIIVSAKDSAVMGDTGYYQVVRGYYQLQQYLNSLVSKRSTSSSTKHDNLRVRVLGDPAIEVNLVPVDFVVNAMLSLAEQPNLRTRALKVFNLVNERPPQLGLLHETACATLNIRGFDLASAADFDHCPMNPLEENLARQISFQTPYMNEETKFSMQRFREFVSIEKVPMATVDQSYLAALNHTFCQGLSSMV